MQKNAVEKVIIKQAVLQQTILGSKNPKNKWRPILVLSSLNKFLKSGKFKMETLESIRTSLQTGEWIITVYFKDAYFHIPINPQSRKYLPFHVQGLSYQFKVLSTAPLEFTMVVMEVKTGVYLCYYLDRTSGIRENKKNGFGLLQERL